MHLQHSRACRSERPSAGVRNGRLSPGARTAAACSEHLFRRMVREDLGPRNQSVSQSGSHAPQYLKRGVAGGADCAAGWMGLAELQYQERKYQDSYETGAAGCAPHCGTPTHTCCRVSVPFLPLPSLALARQCRNPGLALSQCVHSRTTKTTHCFTDPASANTRRSEMSLLPSFFPSPSSLSETPAFACPIGGDLDHAAGQMTGTVRSQSSCANPEGRAAGPVGAGWSGQCGGVSAATRRWASSR